MSNVLGVDQIRSLVIEVAKEEEEIEKAQRKRDRLKNAKRRSKETYRSIVGKDLDRLAHGVVERLVELIGININESTDPRLEKLIARLRKEIFQELIKTLNTLILASKGKLFQDSEK
tara:strand:- start:1399 stop:1749 length:351 start_codon:yes stop_codon:yes gene_type:complete